jgi:hypothetical protein
MHSLIFLVVELETARTTLLNVFEAANGTPEWTLHPPLPRWAGWLKNKPLGQYEREIAH